MFLLRRLTGREVGRICSGDVAREFAKWRNYAWSTLSGNVGVMAQGQEKLRLRKYSNEVKEKASGLGAVNEVEMEDAETTDEETTDSIFEEIANGDAQLLRKLKLLQFEVEVLRQSENNMPSILRKKDWTHLSTLQSMSARKKFLVFLFKNEKRWENKLYKKKMQREAYFKMKEEGLVGSDPLEYSLNHQCLFMRIYNKSLNTALRLRNDLSENIAQHIVFDCSFQEYMTFLNTKFCAMQLLYCLNVNLYHQYPCLIKLCNLKKEDILFKLLPNYILNFHHNNFPWETYEGSYLDHYPKEKLVYLTPHCNESLVTLYPEDVYIIGAFVDKGVGVKASLARAKKNKLRMAKLPLDEYIRWRQGTKSLPLNTVLKILLDMKLHQDWPTALKNVPRRHYNMHELNFKSPIDLLV